MHRARKRKFSRRRRKAPFLGRLLRRHLGLEQLCDECSSPYLDRYKGDPIETVVSGSVIVEIYMERRFGRTNYFVRIGRCAAGRDHMVTCQLLSPEHFGDIQSAISQADALIGGQKPLRLVSRK